MLCLESRTRGAQPQIRGEARDAGRRTPPRLRHRGELEWSRLPAGVPGFAGRPDLSGARDRGGGKRVHRRLRRLLAQSARGACASWRARATSASPEATTWAFARPRAPTWLSSTTTPPPIPGGSTRWWPRPRPTPPWACARRGSMRGGGRTFSTARDFSSPVTASAAAGGASRRMGSVRAGSGRAPAERLRRSLSALHARRNRSLRRDFFAYCEDTDLGLRARIAGWRCRYVPTVVRHHYSGSTGPHSPFKAFHVERNRIWVVVKCLLRHGRASLFYTMARYALQLYATLIGRGAAASWPRAVAMVLGRSSCGRGGRRSHACRRCGAAGGASTPRRGSGGGSWGGCCAPTGSGCASSRSRTDGLSLLRLRGARASLRGHPRSLRHRPGYPSLRPLP